MNSVVQDLRYAIRRLRAAPGFTLACVLTLGIGIGGAVATFTVVDAVALQPLPFPDASRLVRLRMVTPQGDPFPFSEPEYLDFSARLRTVTAMAALRPLQLTLTDAGDAARLDAAAVTPSIFPLLGIHAAIGRDLSVDDRDDGVMISDALWRQRLGGDAGAVGRRLTLDGRAATIVGVLPPAATFPAADIWRPLVPSAAAARGDHWLDVVARLAPGASERAAGAEAAAVAVELSREYPQSQGWSARAEPLGDWLVGPGLRLMVWVLFTAVAALLALACANIAGLLMARAAGRRTEMGVRAALGAGRARLVRQLVTESLLLGIGGAAAGVLVASWILAGLSGLLHDVLPLGRTAAVDGRAIAAATVLMTLCTLAFGLLPALHAASDDVRSALRADGRGATRGGRRWSGGLVAMQVAVAMVLLIGASMLGGSFVRLTRVDAGFDSRHVFTLPLSLPDRRYSEEARTAFFETAIARIAAIPGVESAAATATNPFRQWGFANDVTPEERAAGAPASGLLQAGWRSVTPGYFETLRVPLVEGRLLTNADRAGALRVALISRSLAARLWPGESAVGHRFLWGGTRGRPRTVVGVVGDVRDTRLEAPATPMVYLAYGQLPLEDMTLLVRAHTDGAGVPDAIRRELRALDASLPSTDIRLLDDNRRAAISAPRFRTIMLGLFGTVALLLSSVGLYGMIAFTVSERTREIAIRMALGAGPAQVAGLFFRRGVTLTAMGAAAGLFLAWAAAGALEALLFETSVRDPRLFALPTLVLLVVALTACYVPARRAALLDPATKL